MSSQSGMEVQLSLLEHPTLSLQNNGSLGHRLGEHCIRMEHRRKEGPFLLLFYFFSCQLASLSFQAGRPELNHTNEGWNLGKLGSPCQWCCCSFGEHWNSFAAIVPRNRGPFPLNNLVNGRGWPFERGFGLGNKATQSQTWDYSCQKEVNRSG